MSIIIKPSAFSPLSAYILGKIIRDIDFPAGVVNILSGPTRSCNYAAKVKIPSVLTMIGRRLLVNVDRRHATSIKKLSMELGGNAPFIVFEDADIDKALDLAIE